MLRHPRHTYMFTGVKHACTLNDFKHTCMLGCFKHTYMHTYLLFVRRINKDLSYCTCTIANPRNAQRHAHEHTLRFERVRLVQVSD